MHILEMHEPFLSENYPYAEMTLIEAGEVIISDNETADVVNTVLSTIVSNLNLPEYPILSPYNNKIRNPVLKATVNRKIMLV